MKSVNPAARRGKWLNTEGYPYESIEIRESPPSLKELKEMLAIHAGQFKKIMNTSSKDYRDPKVKEKLPQMSEDENFIFAFHRTVI